MTIESTVKKDALMIKLGDRLDLETAPELDKFLKENIEGIKSVEFDMKKVEYISSAGLRVFLWLRKQFDNKEDVTLKHLNDTVRSVFDLTGFADMFVIK